MLTNLTLSEKEEKKLNPAFELEVKP